MCFERLQLKLMLRHEGLKGIYEWIFEELSEASHNFSSPTRIEKKKTKIDAFKADVSFVVVRMARSKHKEPSCTCFEFRLFSFPVLFVSLQCSFIAVYF